MLLLLSMVLHVSALSKHARERGRATFSGRTDLSRALAGAPQLGGAARRGPSVPPQRRSSFGQLEPVPTGGSVPSGRGYRYQGPPGPGPPHRGRSASPAHAAGGGSQFVWPGAAPPPAGGGDARPGRSPHHAQQGQRPHVGGSRAQSRGPSRGQSPTRGGGDSLTIGWNELILPEQLQFGPSLGSGGSAQVYRGSWQGQEVAIKKISGVAHLR
ncbi:unnamed protein product [Prorocentrum cordatum]|uniref:Receptor protein serine/threonine kinase n=1 Tax=Prorocentrum cordatum TaxID=2364126 RepID=A0ABN9QH57_9DINO|nr:unnamed protein product [Polarella glacialis]